MSVDYTEIDNLVIEHVLCWREVYFVSEYDYLNSSEQVEYSSSNKFSPSTNIADAWLVLDTVCRKHNWRAIIDRNQTESEVNFKTQMGGHVQYYGIAETITLAICYAVLESVGFEFL